VLSLRPSGARKLRWDPETIQVAVRSGLVGAVDAAEKRGDLPRVIAWVLRVAARHAPVQFLIKGGTRISDFLNVLLP